MVEAEGTRVSMACDVVGLERSSLYSVPQRKPKPEDLVIEGFLRQCVEQRPRRGFWKCYKLARRKGFVWNHKRVYRVYRQIGRLEAVACVTGRRQRCSSRCRHRWHRVWSGPWIS